MYINFISKGNIGFIIKYKCNEFYSKCSLITKLLYFIGLYILFLILKYFSTLLSSTVWFCCKTSFNFINKSILYTSSVLISKYIFYLFIPCRVDREYRLPHGTILIHRFRLFNINSAFPTLSYFLFFLLIMALARLLHIRQCQVILKIRISL